VTHEHSALSTVARFLIAFSPAVLSCSAAPVPANGTSGSASDVGSQSLVAANGTDPAQNPASQLPGAIYLNNEWLVPLPDDYRADAPQTPWQEMAVEELAKAMSPIVGHAGRRYRAVRPNEDLARATLSGRLLGDVAGNFAPGLPPSSSAVHLDYLFNPSNPGVPEPSGGNSDFREINVNGYPYSTVVYLQITYSDGTTGTCTGTYVGGHFDTLLTAAHCLDNNNLGAASITFTPAAYGQTGNGTVTSAPFGSFNGCYNTAIPSGWGTTCSSKNESNACTPFDYAVVDFRPCGNPTIASTGTMGVIFNATSLTNVRVDGFPSWYAALGTPPNPVSTFAFSGSPPCGLNNNPLQAWPAECGESGPAALNGPRLESGVLIETPGDSGGPWWVAVNGSIENPALIAITTGFDFYPCGRSTCYRNFGRYIDTSVWNFIVANSLF
jgi:hypothetical protein